MAVWFEPPLCLTTFLGEEGTVVMGHLMGFDINSAGRKMPPIHTHTHTTCAPQTQVCSFYFKDYVVVQSTHF